MDEDQEQHDDEHNDRRGFRRIQMTKAVRGVVAAENVSGTVSNVSAGGTAVTLKGDTIKRGGVGFLDIEGVGVFPVRLVRCEDGEGENCAGFKFEIDPFDAAEVSMALAVLEDSPDGEWRGR